MRPSIGAKSVMRRARSSASLIWCSKDTTGISASMRASVARAISIWIEASIVSISNCLVSSAESCPGRSQTGLVLQRLAAQILSLPPGSAAFSEQLRSGSRVDPHHWRPWPRSFSMVACCAAILCGETSSTCLSRISAASMRAPVQRGFGLEPAPRFLQLPLEHVALGDLLAITTEETENLTLPDRIATPHQHGDLEHFPPDRNLFPIHRAART